MNKLHEYDNSIKLYVILYFYTYTCLKIYLYRLEIGL